MSNTWPGGFHEQNTAYYASVGYLCHQWNNVEHFVYSLGSVTLSMPLKMHGILFRHMGVMSVLSFVEDYVAEHLRTDDHEQIKHVKKYVDRCRMNRNIIIHGFPESDAETGENFIRSMPDKNRKIAKSAPISVEAVRRVCEECEEAGMLLIHAQFLVDPSDHLQSLFGEQIERTRYAKPPLPVFLGETPRDPPAPRTSPQSSPP